MDKQGRKELDSDTNIIVILPLSTTEMDYKRKNNNKKNYQDVIEV